MAGSKDEYRRMLASTGTRKESAGDPVTDPLSPDSYGVWQKFSPGLDFLPGILPRCFDDVVLPGVASRVLLDPERDTILLRHVLVWTLVHLPSAILTVSIADSLDRAWFWAITAAHLFLWFTAMDTYVLGLHCISHRRVFTDGFRSVAYFWYVWVLGPIFGETPETYYAHHIGMHHPFNNGYKDLSSTLTYQRDSFVHWLCYFFRFLFCHGEFYRLMGKRNPKVVARFFAGEISWVCFALWAAFVCQRPCGTLVAVVVPVLVMRMGMMAGNWGQHAYINPADPLSNFGHSVNIVGSSYNLRCYNDGYHIMHHMYPNAHYTELPLLYAKDFELLREKDCLVFKHPHWDFTTVWFHTLCGNWDTLARHVVDLGHGRTHEEKKKMLKERAQRVYSAPLREASVAKE
eukprot:TRINITY_DN43674_c0_g1_i1.p1 TRINITY_DN43674_c0_g1~~TRINITY_DN43674_c0_g1_i1.p1  ORF type:complete len:403 (+),score=99.20 TRINITY_DN43674_c0_g1_i1:67-1275(+)